MNTQYAEACLKDAEINFNKITNKNAFPEEVNVYTQAAIAQCLMGILSLMIQEKKEE